jgi:protein-S-isoprenylcysteine O-methyltransferase Ste14
MLRVLARLVVDAALVAVALFVSAGTLAWWRAWVLLGVLLAVRVVSALVIYQVNPELLRERAGLPVHSGQPAIDKLLLFAVIGTGFFGLSLLAGFDVFHVHVLPRPAPIVSAIGLVLFIAGWCIKALALRENAFATSVVRLQRERRHAVVDTGVYRVVRHPFYAADPLIFIGLALWLESYGAALFSVVPIVLVLVRLTHEERFLRRELPGYTEYATRVRWRLVPGIW